VFCSEARARVSSGDLVGPICRDRDANMSSPNPTRVPEVVDICTGDDPVIFSGLGANTPMFRVKGVERRPARVPWKEPGSEGKAARRKDECEIRLSVAR
jgi:hypothetical protein